MKLSPHPLTFTSRLLIVGKFRNTKTTHISEPWLKLHDDCTYVRARHYVPLEKYVQPCIWQSALQKQFFLGVTVPWRSKNSHLERVYWKNLRSVCKRAYMQISLEHQKVLLLVQKLNEHTGIGHCQHYHTIDHLNLQKLWWCNEDEYRLKISIFYLAVLIKSSGEQ